MNESLTAYRATVHVQQIFLKKNLKKIYASFGIFCVQIGQLFEAQQIFQGCLKIDKSLVSKENVFDFEFFRKFKDSLCLE